MNNIHRSRSSHRRRNKRYRKDNGVEATLNGSETLQFIDKPFIKPTEPTQSVKKSILRFERVKTFFLNLLIGRN